MASEREHRCSCVHAPEQHGPKGCGVIGLMTGPCTCAWSGVDQKTCAHAFVYASDPPICARCGQTVHFVGDDRPRTGGE